MVPPIGVAAVVVVPASAGTLTERVRSALLLSACTATTWALVVDPRTLFTKDVLAEAVHLLDDAGGPAVGLWPPGGDTMPFAMRPTSDDAKKTFEGFSARSAAGELRDGVGMHLCVDAASMAVGLLGARALMVADEADGRALATAERRRDNTTTKPPRVRFYAVLLERRSERVAMVDAMRTSLRMLEVVPAVDGAAELGEAELKALADAGFLVPPFVHEFGGGGGAFAVNQVASFLSHRKAIARVAEDCRAGLCDFGVVLEDDVELRPGFAAAVEAVASSSSSSQGNEVDVVQLYVMPSQRMSFRKTWDRAPCVRELKRSPPGTWGMQAYLIAGADAADKLLRGLWPMRGATDEQLSRVPGLELYALTGCQLLREDDAAAPSVTAASPRTVRDVISHA